MFPFNTKSVLGKIEALVHEGERLIFTAKQSRCMICDKIRGNPSFRSERDAPWQTQRRYAQHSNSLDFLCEECETGIPWIENVVCETCGRDVRCYDCERRLGTSFIYSRSAVKYDQTMKAWLGQYKFRKNERLANLFVSMMRHPLLLMLDQLAESEQEFACLTYVPLSEQRMEERGFNQAEMIARGLSEICRIETIPLLTRLKHTNKQSYKNRAARLRDLNGAFVFNEQSYMNQRLVQYSIRCDGRSSGLSTDRHNDRSSSQSSGQHNNQSVDLYSDQHNDQSSGQSSGQHNDQSVDQHNNKSRDLSSGQSDCDKLNVLLIDDVYTTGSTMHECASVIKSAIHARVYGLTWAR